MRFPGTGGGRGFDSRLRLAYRADGADLSQIAGAVEMQLNRRTEGRPCVVGGFWFSGLADRA
jgi:hypothetical protein